MSDSKRYPIGLQGLANSITQAIDTYVDETADNVSAEDVHYQTVALLLTRAVMDITNFLDREDLFHEINEKLAYAMNEIVNEALGEE